MQKYKIVTLLNSFSDDELKKFNDFLNCCYFNTRKKPAELFQILQKQIGKISEDNFPKEKFYKKIYGETKQFNKNTFNDLTSQLFHLAEDFLYFEHLKHNERKKEIYLMQKYSEKSYEMLFANKHNQIKKLIAANPVLDSELFDDIYNMNINELNYFQIHKSIRKQKDFDFVLKGIMNSSANLTNYYLLELASNYINVLVRRNLFMNQKIEADFKKIARHVFSKNFLKTINLYNEYYYIVDVYKNMLEMFIYLDKNHLYHEYKSSIQTHIDKFSTDERSFHYSNLISYCSLRLIKNYADSEIRKELTHIAREIITNKYFITSRNLHLGIPLFRIFLDNFVYLKDSSAIELLIDECIPLMEKKFKASHKNLALMYLNFLNENYTCALVFLGKVNIEYFQMIYAVKSSYIKIHYHLNNVEQVLSETETYIKFLKSNKAILREKRIKESDFAKITRRIVLAENKNKVNDIAYLNHLIQKNPNIANKEWLLEITNDYLEKNKKIKIAR